MITQDDSISPKTLLLYAVILVVVWGSAFTLITIGIKYVSPAWLVAYRLLLGTVILVTYMFVRGGRFPALSDKRWLWYSVLGITGMSLPFFLVSTGQLVVPSGLSAILIGAMPIITIILAHFFTEERLTVRKLIGFLVGFMGIIVLFLPDDFSLDLVADWKSQLLILGGAACYAITTVGAKRAPKTSSTVGACMMLVAATASAFIGALLYSGVSEAIPPAGEWFPLFVTVFILGVGSTAFATILYLYVIEKTGPSVIAKVNYFVPVASVALGVQFLNEPFKLQMVIAFAVIILGIIISREKKSSIANASPSMPQTD